MRTARWTATWSFTTHSGVSSGSTSADSFMPVSSAVSRAAEKSLANLTEEENDEMDEPWNRFISAFELHAEAMAKSDGRWEYSASGWAHVTVTCAM